MKSIAVFNVVFNNLEGSLGGALTALPNLASLNVAQNFLSGALRYADILAMPSLAALDVSSNCGLYWPSSLWCSDCASRPARPRRVPARSGRSPLGRSVPCCRRSRRRTLT
jgi:hypothetical protein